MNPKKRETHRYLGIGTFLGACLGLPVVAPAAPGDLAQVPLFLTLLVQPNIFFVLDDSGSMDSEVLQSTEARAIHPTYDSEVQLDFTPNTIDEVLRLCAGYNVLAYDPDKTYEPWRGTDRDSQLFDDYTLTTARSDPADPTGIDDLTYAIYFAWDDADGDGVYDDNECPKPDLGDYMDDNIDWRDCPEIKGCFVAQDLDADAQTNFANWYSYYRKREYVLKGALSRLIDDADQRMGMASLHNTGGVSTPVTDMSDPVTESVCGSGLTNKECMLQRLYRMDANSGGNTPLRQALAEAGMYFDQTDGLYHEYLGPAAESPILPGDEGGDCQQNFAIVMSDGFWNGFWPTTFSRYFWPITHDSAGQLLPKPGDADSDGTHDDYNPPWDMGAQADSAVPPPKGPGPDPARTCFPDSPEIGDPPRSDETLADVAMLYYETDLSDLPNNVPTFRGVDENPQQHLVTFTIAFGIEGSLRDGPPQPTDPDDDIRSVPFPWPYVCAGSFWTIDDMRHAAWNARGEFLSAGDPETLSKALSEAVKDVEARSALASAVSFNTSFLEQDTLVFIAGVDPEGWSGDVLAYYADDLLDGLDPGDDPVWSAAKALDRDPPFDPLSERFILTRGASGDGVPVTTDQGDLNWGELSLDTREDFNTNTSGGTDSDAVGQGRLAFLMGDQGCERGGPGTCNWDLDDDGSTAETDHSDKTLRTRTSRLGDIVHGGSIFVGKPVLNWPFDGYAKFKSDKGEREKVVYVGANDGMLHGFSAEEKGKERIAFMPSALVSTGVQEGYHYLTEPNYAHRYYVDLVPAVSDAYIANEHDRLDSGKAWRTLAVGGLGAGGRGYYALDITEPKRFTRANAENIYLWEFTSADDAELGFTFSKPVIAMMENGEWAAIVGSGYNDTGINDAHLFIIYLEGGLDGVWTEGSDYLKIPVPQDSELGRNGLSTPAVADMDGDGMADRVYAGDLLGNMWVFDLRKFPSYETHRLFTAKDSNGDRQPITVKPSISIHPIGYLDTEGNWPNVMVYFGTGQYLVDSDIADVSQQSVYGVWDRGVSDSTIYPINRRDDLREQIISGEVVVGDVKFDWASPDNEDGDYGWYIDLTERGERVVVDLELRDDVLFFNSMVPSDDECSPGGYGYLNVVDAATGGEPESPVVDTNGDGIFDEQDMVDHGGEAKVPSRSKVDGIPSESRFLEPQPGSDDPARQMTGLSDGMNARGVVPLQILDTGRLHWLELTEPL